MTVFLEAPGEPAHRAAGRILAIDYGRRRIGLAISDALELLSRPLATLVRTNRRQDIRRLRGIVRQHGIRRIIVGHPLHLDGQVSEMGEEAARFAARISKQLALPVELVDERLTSWEAKQVLNQTQASRPKHPRNIGLDALAAALMLKEYLERTDREMKG